MKICFVSAYPPNKGYLAEYSDYLTTEIKKRKEVDEIIILANKAKDCKDFEQKGKLKIIRCWQTNSHLIPFQIIKEISRLDVDIIHFNVNMMNWGTGKLVNFLGYSTPFLIKFLRKKVIVTLHNIATAMDLKKSDFISPTPINKLGMGIATKFLLSANKLTVTISSYKKILEKQYKANNVVHIPHGFIQPVKKIKLVDNKILAFGFWDPRKKLELIIKTFKEIKKNNKDIKLIIAGTNHSKFPNYLEGIKRKYNNSSIIFTGYVPQNKVKELFLNSSLLVCPYVMSVGSSGVLHLAASYGKPVVISKIEDVVKVVNEENLLVELTEISNLKKSIEKVLYNKKLQKKMIKYNLKSAKKLSFEVIAKKFASLYEEVLKK